MTTASNTKVAVPGPVAGTRWTEAMVRQIGSFAYMWAWPMVNLHNRRVAFAQVPEHGLVGGVMPAAPLNNVTMLSDYAPPEQRFIATPNQDVVYGFGILSLDREPVVVQVPDFGDRFWVYQLGDQRTDGFGDLGSMYGFGPGCYLLVGPGWDGDTPEGITGMFRSPTDLGVLIPRIFMDDTAEDRAAIGPLVAQVMAYPLSQFTGEPRTMDWTGLPTFPAPQTSGGAEVRWVDPDTFFDVLPQVLAEVPPLAGEEALYGLLGALVEHAADNPGVRSVLTQVAQDAEATLVGPLFEYRNEGVDAGNGWGVLRNAARFGTDYVTRVAAAKANIFANRPEEATYYFTDVDGNGDRLHGGTYTLTFAAGQLPPVHGFWSLTVYDRYHFFVPNEIDRYSLGTKNRDLHRDDAGALTIHVGPRPPDDGAANWLPCPDAAEFSLILRAYWPTDAVTDGDWTPPAVTRTH